MIMGTRFRDQLLVRDEVAENDPVRRPAGASRNLGTGHPTGESSYVNVPAGYCVGCGVAAARQLNKGESIHARRDVVYAHEGAVRRQLLAEQTGWAAGCS